MKEYEKPEVVETLSEEQVFGAAGSAERAGLALAVGGGTPSTRDQPGPGAARDGTGGTVVGRDLSPARGLGRARGPAPSPTRSRSPRDGSSAR